jgi:hypothetical protein
MDESFSRTRLTYRRNLAERRFKNFKENARCIFFLISA